MPTPDQINALLQMGQISPETADRLMAQNAPPPTSHPDVFGGGGQMAQAPMSQSQMPMSYPPSGPPIPNTFAPSGPPIPPPSMASRTFEPSGPPMRGGHGRPAQVAMQLDHGMPSRRDSGPQSVSYEQAQRGMSEDEHGRKRMLAALLSAYGGDKKEAKLEDKNEEDKKPAGGNRMASAIFSGFKAGWQ